jgi:TRAP-type C4-dicarboxylate transport system permease small subunit
MMRLYHRLLDLNGLICGLLILALMLGVAADVAVRSVTGRPILWMFEITEYTLLFIPCIGMAWLAREHGHVAITSFVRGLPDRPRRALAVATLLLCATACLLVAGWAGYVLSQSLARGTVVGMMLQIPEWRVFWVVPFGFGLAAIEFARLAIFEPVPPDMAPEH